MFFECNSLFSNKNIALHTIFFQNVATKTYNIIASYTIRVIYFVELIVEQYTNILVKD